MSTPARHASASTRTSPGQTIVLFALASLVLLGALGLALDGGYDYIQRRAMQNTAEAAAMAGAGAIAQKQTDTGVTQAVLDAAARNGVTDTSRIICTFITNSYTATSPGVTRPCSPVGGVSVAMSSFSDNFTGVLVRVSEQHPTFVFRALGTATSGTAATAAARVQRPTGVVGGPFMVCGVDTTVNNGDASFKGGIFKTTGIYNVTTDSKGNILARTDTFDLCSNGACGKVQSLTGKPEINSGAYAYKNASRQKYLDQNGNQIVGPAYLIHAPNGNSLCNNSSKSFNGVNTALTTYNDTFFPADSNDDGTRNPGAKLPPITTGNVSSVQATVNGLNGCQVGQAIDNCVMILPVIDASGPGGTGNNALLAVRSLQAFYVRQIATGSHTGELIENYSITANSDPTYIVGTSGVTVLKIIR